MAARQRGRSYPEIREGLEPVRAVCAVVPITLETTIWASTARSGTGFPGTTR